MNLKDFSNLQLGDTVRGCPGVLNFRVSYIGDTSIKVSADVVIEQGDVAQWNIIPPPLPSVSRAHCDLIAAGYVKIEDKAGERWRVPNGTVEIYGIWSAYKHFADAKRNPAPTPPPRASIRRLRDELTAAGWTPQPHVGRFCWRSPSGNHIHGTRAAHGELVVARAAARVKADALSPDVTIEQKRADLIKAGWYQDASLCWVRPAKLNEEGDSGRGNRGIRCGGTNYSWHRLNTDLKGVQK